MSKVQISEVKPGMIIEKPVYSPTDHKLLLTYGTTLQDITIKKLKALGIKKIEIADKNTIFVMPMEKMGTYLKKLITM